jgi:hypothetical protein
MLVRKGLETAPLCPQCGDAMRLARKLPPVRPLAGLVIHLCGRCGYVGASERESEPPSPKWLQPKRGSRYSLFRASPPSDNETISCRPIGQLEAIPYPPDGQTREWWHRLKNALGTRSSAFVAASVQQLIAAARLPNSGISEVAVNASLAFIEGAKPRDELECALVIQMACTHSATMAVLSRLGGRPRWRSKCCCDGVRGGPVAARLRNPGRGVTPAEERRLSNCPGRTCPCE